MLTAGRIFEAARLVDLERTVDSLNGQLREMQWELYRAKAEPLSMRLWRNGRSFAPERRQPSRIEAWSAESQMTVSPGSRIVPMQPRLAW